MYVCMYVYGVVTRSVEDICRMGGKEAREGMGRGVERG